MSPGVPVPYQSIWLRSAPPNNRTPGSSFIVRNTFYTIQSGQILGIQFYRGSTDQANHFGFLTKRGTAGNRELKRGVAFRHNASGVGLVGWQTVYFHPLRIASNEWYDVAVEWSGQFYYYWAAKIATTRYVSGDIIVPADGSVDPFGITVPNGGFTTALTFNPNVADSGNLQGVDILFLRD